MTSPTSPGSSSAVGARPDGPARCVGRRDRVTTGPRWSRSAGRTLSWALPKRSIQSTSARSAAVRLRRGRFGAAAMPARLSGSMGWPRRVEVGPGGQASGGRGEEVPAGEGGARPAGAGAAGSSTAAGEAAEGGGGGEEESVVGADEDGAGGGDLDGDRPPGGAHAGVDDGEDHAGRQPRRGPPEGERPGPHVVGRDLVGDVDDGTPGARVAMTRWTTPTNSSSSP